MSKSVMERINDGWANLFTGAGTPTRDKVEGSFHVRDVLLMPAVLSGLYYSDGFGARVVDEPVDDALRNGWTIGNDKDEKLKSETLRLGAVRAVKLAHKWQRVFGGALIVADFDRDTSPLEKPPSAGARCIGFRTFSSARIQLGASDVVSDPIDPRYGDYDVYAVSQRGGEPFRVHVSRCYVMKGIPVPDYIDGSFSEEAWYWGMSAMQRPYRVLKSFGMFYQSLGTLAQEATIGKFRISNLEKLLLQESNEEIKQRVQIMDMCKSAFRAVLLAKDEDYTRDSLNFAGVADVFDRMAMLVSSVSRIPVTRLFGRSAAGENATGEGDSRNYYDFVKSEQDEVDRPALAWCAKMANRNVRVLADAVEPVFVFEPVWTPTQSELITMRANQQKIDAGYIADGVYNNLEVRECRFPAGGGYSFETNLAPLEGSRAVAGGAPSQDVVDDFTRARR